MFLFSVYKKALSIGVRNSSTLTSWLTPTLTNGYYNYDLQISNEKLHANNKLGVYFSTGSQTQSMTSMRLRLEQIFNREREYLFTTTKNIRDYEWTVDDVEALYESISEIDIETNTLELGWITIMKRDAVVDGGQCNQIVKGNGRHDVHDGQQRLVTLSLLLAAIRDVLDEKFPDGKDTADEAWAMIYPKKSRSEPVCRIELRETGGNKFLCPILSKIDQDSNEYIQDVRSILPAERARTFRHINVSDCDRRIVKAYNYFRERIEKLEEEYIFSLFDKIGQGVYLFVCVPTYTQMARHLVMNQNKGKNMQPVDWFKGLICFDYNVDESVQNSTLVSWMDLVEDVGDEVVRDTCLIYAQYFLETRVTRSTDVDLMEQYIRKRISSGVSDGKDIFCKARFGINEPNRGEILFREEIEPTAKTLFEFRNETKPQFELDATSGVDSPSLAFLRSSATIATCKEIDLPVLVFIIRYSASVDPNEEYAISRKLKELERIAIWMMITKPAPKIRFQRCLDILTSSSSAFLTAAEITETIDGLRNSNFEKPAIRAAILQRLNEYLLVKNSKNRLTPMKRGCTIEHVLPIEHAKVEDWNAIWPAEDSSEWIQKLGNFALLDAGSNSKIGNKGFETKRTILRDSPYPLTKQIGILPQWDVEALKENHEKYVELAKEVWDLNPNN